MTTPETHYDLLYAEDDACVCRSFTRLMGEHPYRLFPAATPDDARRQFSSRLSWAGIIADYHLPGGTGLSLILELRRTFADIPGVIVTADDSAQVCNEAARAGVRFVRKPFGIPDLGPFLEEVIEYERSAGGPRVRGFAIENRLTTREIHVLNKSLEGKPATAIADDLGIRVGTVRTYRTRLLRKVGVASIDVLRSSLLS